MDRKEFISQVSLLSAMTIFPGFKIDDILRDDHISSFEKRLKPVG